MTARRDAFTFLADAMVPRDTMAETFDALGYTPTPRQHEFHAATEFDVLYGGAAGGGKTAALVAEAVRRCLEFPGLRVAAFRRTYDELSESLLAALAKFGYADTLGAKWNGTERELRFPNGSLIRFRYAENLVDASRRQGGEYQLLVLDERGLFAPGVVGQLRERLRSGRVDLPVLGIRSASNPGGADHLALRLRFIDATDYGAHSYTDEQGFTVRFIPARVDDNPHVDAGYRRNLEAIPDPSRRAAMLEGSWDQFAGQFFPEWNRERHVVPAFDVPTTWQRYAGIDWGYRAPWAVVWGALDEDRRVWIYRELYGPGVGEAEQARRILEAEGDEVVVRYADDAMWTGRGDAKSVAEVYAAEGCHLVRARKGDRVIGWQRMHSFLADGPACPHHRATGWETCPMLHVLEGRAPNLVRTIPAMVYDQSRTEDMDTRGDDHAVDACRYLLLNLAEPTINGWLMPETTPTTGGSVYDPLTPWTDPDLRAEPETLAEFMARNY